MLCAIVNQVCSQIVVSMSAYELNMNLKIVSTPFNVYNLVYSLLNRKPTEFAKKYIINLNFNCLTCSYVCITSQLTIDKEQQQQQQKQQQQHGYIGKCIEAEK